MPRPNFRLILVTGAPRSGTTAVGKIISLGRGVGNLHEPFNRLVGIREIQRYFEVPGTETCPTDTFDNWVTRIQTLDLKFKPGVFPREKAVRRLFKYIVGGRAKNAYRLCRLNPLIHTLIWKDPFACFAADRLARIYNTAIIVTVRSPWAVAASFKRMGWGFDVDDILTHIQPLGFELPLRSSPAWKNKGEPAVNGALLWTMIYHMLAGWEERSPQFTLVNLETIVADPISVYSKLYSRVELDWNAAVENKIKGYYRNNSTQTMPVEGKAHDSARDLKSINQYWKKILSEGEQKLIGELTMPVWQRVETICDKTMNSSRQFGQVSKKPAPSNQL